MLHDRTWVRKIPKKAIAIEWRFKVAEWQYRIERIELKPDAEPDAQLEKVLQEYGQQGWELVQVLHGQEAPDNPKCRLIFKTERPFTDVQNGTD
jgi:Domain of unknown function (DUF4177)